MTITLHKGDLPAPSSWTGAVAVDTETLGLNPRRDRLCLVQLSSGDGNVEIVQIAPGQREAPNLARLLSDRSITKIFHYARFDLAALFAGLGVMAEPAFCTKIASRLTRTYSDRHGLKDLTKELIDVDLSKQLQSSDWGAETLTEAQLEYAASDVLYLHRLKDQLDQRLDRDGRRALAESCFAFLPTRALLDLAGWPDTDIFAHS